MINCGIQCLSCDYPAHFDTYKGCEHACKYCFVKNKYSITKVEPKSQKKSLENWISGKRNCETSWCDWNIPLHWGGNSDPFQPLEKEYHKSLECLEIFARSKYPFIVSTKNPVMLTEEPYFSLLKECRCVLQISMACSRYDKLETGAPTYEERLKAAEMLSGNVTRIIARIRPYFPDCHEDIVKELPRMAKAGIFGISISSFVSTKKQKEMKRYGTKYLFPIEDLAPNYREIKQVCHEVGLKFFCCEDSLDHWSDDLTCCGTVGLDDFKPNLYNCAHLAYDDPPPEPTDAMMSSKTFRPFKCIGQEQTWAQKVYNKSFADLMIEVGGKWITWNKLQKDIWGE